MGAIQLGHLSYCYAKGLGTEVDPIQAQHWQMQAQQAERMQQKR